METVQERQEIRRQWGSGLIDVMLKSPVSRRREEREDAMVRSSESSERKDGCGFGGR